MAGLRVFISSTCADLDAYRFQLRALLERLGYEPVMSDHSEVLYDPDLHTHASCIRDVQGADLMILLVGSRFGGTTVDHAIPMIDFDQASKLSSSTALLKEKNKISITQAEAIQSTISDIPLFTFVDSKVYSDHHVYQANKSNPSLPLIKFPSIQNQDHAHRIFDFINFISHRSHNNAVITFSSFSDIENHLLKQWSLLFQRLIQEKREKSLDNKRSVDIISKFDELKSAVLQSLPQGTERDIARAIVRHRKLVDFLLRTEQALGVSCFKKFQGSYDELLKEYDVSDIVWDNATGSPYYAVLILSAGGFLGCFSHTDDEVIEYADEWPNFACLTESIKQCVIDAATDLTEDRRKFERHAESYKDYSSRLEQEELESPAPRRRPRRIVD